MHHYNSVSTTPNSLRASFCSLFAFAFLFLPIFASAQKMEGEVTYKETVKLNIQLGDGPEAEEMRKMMPSERSIAKTLFFDAKESLYKDADVQKEGDGNMELNTQHDDSDVQLNFKMSNPDNRIYRDLNAAKTIESTEFFGKQFLISEDSKKLQWKISNEQKQILGMLCQKANMLDSTRQVEAWFTTSIPLAVGPAGFYGLPGLVMEVTINNGDLKIEATQVNLKKLDKKSLEKPSKGKAVTRDEFKKIRDEKLKEMGAEDGGGGMMRVIIRN